MSALNKGVEMKNRVIFILATIGLLAGLVSAYIFGIEKKPQPPVFNPASNPLRQWDLREWHHRELSDERKRTSTSIRKWRELLPESLSVKGKMCGKECR